MKLDTLTKWDFLDHLQNPNGRNLFTASYLLRYHGYITLANEVEELAINLMFTSDGTEQIRRGE